MEQRAWTVLCRSIMNVCMIKNTFYPCFYSNEYYYCRCADLISDPFFCQRILLQCLSTKLSKTILLNNVTSGFKLQTTPRPGRIRLVPMLVATVCVMVDSTRMLAGTACWGWGGGPHNLHCYRPTEWVVPSLLEPASQYRSSLESVVDS
jgi:hypothetical protein